MAKYIFVFCMLLTTVNSQQCDSYGFMACLEDLYGILRFTVSTEQELETECSKTRESIIPCFEEMQRTCETLYVDVYAVKLYLKALCDKGSFHNEYLKHAKCLFKHEDDLSLCNEFADKNEKERLKYICCEQNQITVCVSERANSDCGPESSSLVVELNKRTSEIFPAILCGEVDQCDGSIRHSISWNILRLFLITLLALVLE